MQMPKKIKWFPKGVCWLPILK